MMQVLNGGFCSNCFNHVLDSRVVEMGAAWEGGVQDGLAIDDLRLCEACVRAAAEILDIEPSTLENSERRAKEAEQKVEAWQTYAEKLERVVDTRPIPKTGRRPKVPA
jgi:hypothetical protein